MPHPPPDTTSAMPPSTADDDKLTRDPMMRRPFSLEHDQERRRVVITLSAKATVAVWQATVSALVAADAWHAPLIYDMSAVESTPLLLNLPNVVSRVADLTTQHGPRDALVAIVHPSNLDMWRNRLSRLFNGLVVVNAFSDLEMAHRWLDWTAPANQTR
jgi:hypothetical protein